MGSSGLHFLLDDVHVIYNKMDSETDIMIQLQTSDLPFTNEPK